MAHGGDSTTWPSGRVTSTLVLPGFAASTPPPPPARPREAWEPDAPAPERRRLRRTVALAAVLGFGLVVGSGAAVLERVLDDDAERGTGTGVEPVPEYAVLSALRPLGTQTFAARGFETDVVTDPGFPGGGEEVAYHGVGDVAATIDFAAVGADDVRVRGPGNHVLVELPGVVLGQPVLDEAKSGLVGYDTSFLDILFGARIDEYELRATALSDLAERARTSGLAEEAAQAAVVEVRRRVAGLGARIVEVRFQQ